MKVVGERKIISSFVAVELYSMADIIRKENENEKNKSQGASYEEKRSKVPNFNHPYLRNGCLGGSEICTGCRSNLDLALESRALRVILGSSRRTPLKNMVSRTQLMKTW